MFFLRPRDAVGSRIFNTAIIFSERYFLKVVVVRLMSRTWIFLAHFNPTLCHKRDPDAAKEAIVAPLSLIMPAARRPPGRLGQLRSLLLRTIRKLYARRADGISSSPALAACQSRRASFFLVVVGE